MARVLAIGGAHLDRTGRLAGPHKAGASNPGRWESHIGGGIFNAARNLARLGHQVTLVSARGGDMIGEDVAAAAEDAGIDDRSMVFLDHATASYTAILEPDGNLVTAFADMAVYDRIPPRRLLTARFRALVGETDLLFCDANFPGPTLETLGLIARRTGKPLAAIAISPAKIVRYADMLGDLSALFMNMAEAQALAGMGGSAGEREGDKEGEGASVIDRLRDTGLGGGIVTAGPEAVEAFLGPESARHMPPPLPDFADVTGAGDAFASGFLHARLAGRDIAACLEWGGTLARLTLAVKGPVRDDLTPSLLEEAVAHRG
jgi:sugar/nucleoside kinase (ribokinase family)